MKINIARVSIIITACMFVCFSIAGIVACTTLHDCKTSTANNNNIINETVTIPANITDLVIKTASHDVTLQNGLELEGKIILESREHKNSNEKEFTLDISTKETSMSITVSKLHNNSFDISDTSRRLLVILPKEYKGSMQVQTVSGDIDATPLTLPLCDFITTSGNLKAKALNCPIMKLTTTSGDFNIDSLIAKEMFFKSVSGDAYFTDIQVEESVTMKSISGDLKTNFAKNPPKNIAIKSVSGDLTLKFLTEPKLTVKIDTTSGDVDSKFAITSILNNDNYHKNDIQGTINGGGTVVELNTVSGDIALGLDK